MSGRIPFTVTAFCFFLFLFFLNFVSFFLSRTWLANKTANMQASGTYTQTQLHFLLNLLHHSRLAADMQQVGGSTATLWVVLFTYVNAPAVERHVRDSQMYAR